MATKQSALYTEPQFISLRVLKNGEHDSTKAVTVKVLLGRQGPKTSPTRNLCRLEHSAEDQRLGRTWQLKSPPSANMREVPDPDLEQLLTQCTSVLGLASSARCAFTDDGRLIRNLKDLEEGQLVFVSTGSKQFVSPANHTESLARKRLLDRAGAELQRMEHLRRLYEVEGLVLSVKTPVLAGAPVVLAPEPCPHTATGLKGTVDMSRDKACHTSHGRQQTPPTADTSTLLTHHDRSHHNAEELRLSRLPSWRKRLAVQAEETTLPPSEDHQRSRLAGPAHKWVWFKDHLLLAYYPTLALAVSDVTIHTGAGLCVAPYKEADMLQLWEHTHDGFLAPLHDHSLVVTVTNLSSLNDKRMSPGLALAPRAKGVWPSAHQKWAELSKDADDRVSLQAFGGSEQENNLTAARISEVCSHSVYEDGPFAQQGYELLPAHVSALSTTPSALVCGGCGRYLKRTHPQLLLRETGGLEVFQCMFWMTHDGASSGLKLSGPLQCFSGKADLSRYEISSTLAVLDGKVRQWRSVSLKEVQCALSELMPVVRRDVVVHQNGARGRGITVKVSTLGGLLHAASVVLSLHAPATMAYLSNGTAVVTMDQLAEGGVEVWVASKGEKFASPETSTEGSDQLTVWECQPDPITPTCGFVNKWSPSSHNGPRQERASRVLRQPKPLHLRVFPSGSSADSAQVIVARSFEELLEQSMLKLHLTSPVKHVFTSNGKQVVSFEELNEGQVVGVATMVKFLQEQDVNHVIARKAKWSRKHRARMRAQI